MPEDGDDFVGHFIDIPEINAEHVGEQLTDARLLRDNDGDIVAHGF